MVYATSNKVTTIAQGSAYMVGAGGQEGLYPTWVATKSPDRSTTFIDISIVSVLYDFIVADMSFLLCWTVSFGCMHLNYAEVGRYSSCFVSI